LTLTLAFTDSVPSANIAGIQWQLALPPGITASAPVAAGSAASNGKVISYNSDNGFTLLAGTGENINANVITSGAIAVVTLTVASTASPGTFTIAFGTDARLLAADVNGNPVELTSSPVKLAILTRFPPRKICLRCAPQTN
jgi:hypothetical protein